MLKVQERIRTKFVKHIQGRQTKAFKIREDYYEYKRTKTNA